MEKPTKYDDAETKKPGSPIETPYKYSDSRRIERDRLAALSATETPGPEIIIETDADNNAA